MKKVLSLLIITILIINLILFGMSKVTQTFFWIIIAAGAIAAYLMRKLK